MNKGGLSFSLSVFIGDSIFNVFRLLFQKIGIEDR